MSAEQTFTTISDVAAWIGDSIEASGAASRDEYDLDTIAHAVTTWDVATQRFVATADADAFWDAVAAHALDES
jgi:hypothetical protein